MTPLTAITSPPAYFQWVNALAKDRKRITTWGQYKLILNGLQAYIDDAQWSKKKSFTIDEATMSPVLTDALHSFKPLRFDAWDENRLVSRFIGFTRCSMLLSL